MTENKINVSDKILILDYFNIINVHELSYILLNETKCNSIYNHDNENITNFLKENSKNSINKVFNQNFEIKVELSRNLLNRTSLTLGEDETEKIINNYNRSKELSVLKYSMEYKNLINDLNNKITNCFKNIKENFNFVLEISNYNYLIRNKISNKDICLLRLNLNFPNYNKIKFNEMYDLVDYLYIFRNKKKLIKQEIKKELIILKEESEKIILEGIEDEINKINENIKDLEFNSYKESLQHLHKINKEKFEITQNIKNENLLRLKEKEKLELEKKEKEFKEYYEEIKIISKDYKSKKIEKKQIEKEFLVNEANLKAKKLKEEIKNKLPLISTRQKESENYFIKNQKQKVLIKEETERNKQMLNNIIENLKVRPKVEIDSERVKKITEGLKIRYETKRDEADKIVLFENHGFTIDNLMKDMRYKISSALNDAGLLGSAYSNEVLNALSIPKV